MRQDLLETLGMAEAMNMVALFHHANFLVLLGCILIVPFLRGIVFPEDPKKLARRLAY